eukprot:3670514-Pleurochrysis_carterae.AAC.1
MRGCIQEATSGGAPMRRLVTCELVSAQSGCVSLCSNRGWERRGNTGNKLLDEVMERTHEHILRNGRQAKASKDSKQSATATRGDKECSRLV